MEIGTEILLKRIQDCPEEFADHDIHGIGRWTRVLHAAKECLPREEIDAIKKAMDEARKQHLLDRFNEQVLKTLAGETDTESDRQAYMTTGAINSTFTNGVITNSQQYGQGFTDPRRAMSSGGMLSSNGNASLLMGQSQQQMAQQQYNALQKAEEFRNAAMQQQNGSSFLRELGRKLFNA